MIPAKSRQDRPLKKEGFFAQETHPSSRMAGPESALLQDVPHPSLPSLPPQAMGLLIIDTQKIGHNYQVLQLKVKKGTRVGAVVKADSYGIGMMPVASCLYERGCRDYFVVNLDEAIQLRTQLSDPAVMIYVLNGVTEGTEERFVESHLIPVLIDWEQIHRWVAYSKDKGQTLPAVLEIDTGMARKGLDPAECGSLKEIFRFLNIHYVMSHLASSNLLDHPQNQEQLALFKKVLNILPSCRITFSNSNGIALGEEYHGDLVRPGIGLYGLALHLPETQMAVRVLVRVVQTRFVKAGHPVGYMSQYRCKRPSRLATLGMGYADGILKSLSNRGYVMFCGTRAPIVGNVSMDSIVVDVTDLPEHLVQNGTWASLYTTREDFFDLADLAGTSPYELMVRLGYRYHRIYI